MKPTEVEGDTVNDPEFINKPPIKRICYTSAEGNPCVFDLGRGVTEIREVEVNSEYCMIPWIEVWDGDHLLARFNQHKLEHIIYARPEAIHES